MHIVLFVTGGTGIPKAEVAISCRQTVGRQKLHQAIVSNEIGPMTTGAIGFCVTLYKFETCQIMVECQRVEADRIEIPAEVVLVARRARRLIERGMQPEPVVDTVLKRRVTGKAPDVLYPAAPQGMTAGARSQTVPFSMCFDELAG
jgi:hypothetical protein